MHEEDRQMDVRYIQWPINDIVVPEILIPERDPVSAALEMQLDNLHAHEGNNCSFYACGPDPMMNAIEIQIANYNSNTTSAGHEFSAKV
jgi:predicted ferric reductase